MAKELAQNGFQVSLIDLSNNYPRTTPADWEGPFGVFRSQDLSDSQIYSMTHAQTIVESDAGFCLWPEAGPIECTGPLSRLQMRRYATDALLDYFRDLDRGHITKDVFAKIQKQTFKNAWPAYFANHLSSLRYKENKEALSSKTLATPFLSPFFHRLASRQAVQESLEDLKNSGVEVFEGGFLRDISEDGKTIQRLELEVSGRSFLIEASRWLIMLSGIEISLLDERVQKILQPYKAAAPQWSWIRYGVEVKQIEDLKSIPPHFVVIDDVYGPWYNTNVMIFQMTTNINQFDIWLRIPNSQRFQKQYLEDIKLEIHRLIGKRLPMLDITDTLMPQEYIYSFNDLGPPRFCMYSTSDLNAQKRKSWRNVTWSSPEEWPAQDATSIMREQTKLYHLLEEARNHDRTL